SPSSIATCRFTSATKNRKSNYSFFSAGFGRSQSLFFVDLSPLQPKPSIASSTAASSIPRILFMARSAHKERSRPRYDRLRRESREEAPRSLGLLGVVRLLIRRLRGSRSAAAAAAAEACANQQASND